MKKVEFMVPEGLLERFTGRVHGNSMNRSDVLRALVSGFSYDKIQIVNGQAETLSKVSASASPSLGESVKPKGRPPKPDESWKMVPGCTSPAQLGVISTFTKLPPKVQDAIKQDNDTGWYEKCFESGSLCLLTEDTYIRKNGLAVSHRFLGDKQ